jgi:hypothetical protein
MVRCFRLGRTVAIELNAVHEAWNSWARVSGLEYSSKDQALGNRILPTRLRQVIWTNKDENVMNSTGGETGFSFKYWMISMSEMRIVVLRANIATVSRYLPT